jgi:hypothetical protein
MEHAHSPGWLQDGRWLFFATVGEGQLSFLNLLERCIVNTEIKGVADPVMSPRGDVIAYADGDLYVIDLTVLFGQDLETLQCNP